MIDILLATYNGEKYISEQLNSLLHQTFQNFSILIRDDCSHDNTLKILENYQKNYPNKIKIISDDFGNIGSSKSFMELLKYTCSPYVMFCDQDDIWLNDKLQKSLEKIENMENIYGKNTPLLVFSDLKVVNSRLKEINSSFWKFQKLNPKIALDWKRLLAQNVITGCTIIMNQESKRVSLPYQLETMMHDQWIGVNVAKYGKIGYINESTLLYRQHDSNVEGAHRYGWTYIVQKMTNLQTPLFKLSSSAHFFQISLIKLIFLKIVINLKRLWS